MGGGGSHTHMHTLLNTMYCTQHCFVAVYTRANARTYARTHARTQEDDCCIVGDECDGCKTQGDDCDKCCKMTLRLPVESWYNLPSTQRARARTCTVLAGSRAACLCLVEVVIEARLCSVPVFFTQVNPNWNATTTQRARFQLARRAARGLHVRSVLLRDRRRVRAARHRMLRGR